MSFFVRDLCADATQACGPFVRKAPKFVAHATCALAVGAPIEGPMIEAPPARKPREGGSPNRAAPRHTSAGQLAPPS